jgi:ABC-type uncharacterized transport system ATPase subunit
MEQLSITIKEGKIEMEVDGVKGSGCLELTQLIEQLMGETENRILKNDFYNRTQMKHRIGIHQKNRLTNDP